jgi:hypothetical protein
LFSVFWFSAKELYYMLVLARCSFLGKDLSSAEKTQVEWSLKQFAGEL